MVKKDRISMVYNGSKVFPVHKKILYNTGLI